MQGTVEIRDLTEQVELQYRTDAPAVGGGTTESYTTIGNPVWAKVVNSTGAFYFQTAQTENTVTHIITVRALQDSDASRVTYIHWVNKSKRLRVQRIRNLDRAPVFQELLCEEVKRAVA